MLLVRGVTSSSSSTLTAATLPNYILVSYLTPLMLYSLMQTGRVRGLLIFIFSLTEFPLNLDPFGRQKMYSKCLRNDNMAQRILLPPPAERT